MAPRFRLNRRDVLRGAGTIAIGLPWLEAMHPEKQAHAAAANVAKRFIAVYQPGGTVMDPAQNPNGGGMSTSWRPSGTEEAFTVGPILAPLSAIMSKVIITNGLNMPSAQGEQHQAGICALLTGMEQGVAGNYPRGPSLDQVIAEIASVGKPRKSLELAVRWATGKSQGLLHPINSMTFSTEQGNAPIPPRIDPQEIYDTLFGTLDPGGGGQSLVARKLSILDYVDRRYETLAQRMGASDRARLEQHLTHLRALETTLSGIPDPTNMDCVQPEHVDTTGYNPRAGDNANQGNNGNCGDAACLSSDELIPEVGRFMTDMLVMAMICDMTGVATLQWSDTEAKHTFPWLGLPADDGNEHHHYYQHDGGFRPVECAEIGTWYSEQHAYLLQQLDAVDLGDHTLLDESVVFFGSELSKPDLHSKTDMPFILAGGGGGMRGNRWLQYGGRSHNDLLAGILNLFGGNVQSFGDARHNTSPVTNLT